MAAYQNVDPANRVSRRARNANNEFDLNYGSGDRRLIFIVLFLFSRFSLVNHDPFFSFSFPTIIAYQLFNPGH